MCGKSSRLRDTSFMYFCFLLFHRSSNPLAFRASRSVRGSSLPPPVHALEFTHYELGAALSYCSSPTFLRICPLTRSLFPRRKMTKIVKVSLTDIRTEDLPPTETSASQLHHRDYCAQFFFMYDVQYLHSLYYHIGM